MLLRTQIHLKISRQYSMIKSASVAIIVGIYILGGFFTSLFINDSGKLSKTKHIIVSIFWLFFIILGIIPFVNRYVNKWVFGTED